MSAAWARTWRDDCSRPASASRCTTPLKRPRPTSPRTARRIPPAGCPAPPAPRGETLLLLGALLAGDWPVVDGSELRHRREARGLVAAYVSWHLERSLRSLPYVEAGEAERAPQAPSSGTPPRPAPRGPRPARRPGRPGPGHVAIIMDGNGRWAEEQGLPRTAGPRARRALALRRRGGGHRDRRQAISAYAFSTENWSRSPDEVRS